MSRILVTYATGKGCTVGVAEKIAEVLDAAGAKADVLAMDSDPRPEDYDAVVAGSSVQAGSWLPAARKWMTRHADELAHKPLAMFTVCIALAQGPENIAEALGYTDKLLARTGLAPCTIGTFAGRYYASEVNPLVRAIMKRKGAREGDFRDWKAIEGWAERVAPLLTKREALSVA